MLIMSKSICSVGSARWQSAPNLSKGKMDDWKWFLSFKNLNHILNVLHILKITDQSLSWAFLNVLNYIQNNVVKSLKGL